MSPEEMARRSSWYQHNGPTIEPENAALHEQLSSLLALAVERGWAEAADWLVDRI